jgi:hypothetical protein
VCIYESILSLRFAGFYIVMCVSPGTIIHTFKMSKDYDDNVKNVSFWMASVRDWLMLVADKVNSSGAVSTLQLFEALQEAMLALTKQV